MRVTKLTDEELKKVIAIEFPALSWITIHGNLCLALRHPQNVGASRPVAISALEWIEQQLFMAGILDQEDIETIHKTEFYFKTGGN